MINSYENQTNIFFLKEKKCMDHEDEKIIYQNPSAAFLLLKKCLGRLHPTLEIAAAAARASSEKKNYNITA